jgi:hypothetical protein
MTMTDYTKMNHDEVLAACHDDPEKWAEAFCQHCKIKPGVDLGRENTEWWFHNAMHRAALSLKQHVKQNGHQVLDEGWER